MSYLTVLLFVCCIILYYCFGLDCYLTTIPAKKYILKRHLNDDYREVRWESTSVQTLIPICFPTSQVMDKIVGVVKIGNIQYSL